MEHGQRSNPSISVFILSYTIPYNPSPPRIFTFHFHLYIVDHHLITSLLSHLGMTSTESADAFQVRTTNTDFAGQQQPP